MPNDNTSTARIEKAEVMLLEAFKPIRSRYPATFLKRRGDRA